MKSIKKLFLLPGFPGYPHRRHHKKAKKIYIKQAKINKLIDKEHNFMINNHLK